MEDSTDAGVSLAEILVADPPEAWRAAGFAVDDDATCRIGGVRVRLVGRDRGTGILGWALRGGGTDLSDLDGVPTTPPTATLPMTAAGLPAHPNGVVAIDHLVLLSPDLGRTVASFAAIGVEPRRERVGEMGGQPVQQVFLRLGAVILEAVGSPGAAGEGPSTLWGVTYVVEDVEAAAAFFDGSTSPVKDAVQPGRRITTLRHRDLGLSVRTALISPHVKA